MKLRSMAVGAAVGALFTMSSVVAWAQADTQVAQAKPKRSISVSPPSDAGRSAVESAVRNARDDAARRAKAKRKHVAALKRKRHAKARHAH